MKRKNTAGNKVARNVLTGVAVGAAVIVLGAMVEAYMIHTDMMSLNGVGYASAVTMLVASFLAALIGGRGTTGKARLITVLAAGIGLCIVLFVCNIALFGADLSGAGITMLLILGCSLSVFLLLSKGHGKKFVKIPKL